MPQPITLVAAGVKVQPVILEEVCRVEAGLRREMVGARRDE